jgi:two-component system response regulator AtoC
MRVLVIDDESYIRDLVSKAMVEQGCRVWTAASGEEALELVTDQDFDLIFCDVVMGGMNGLEVLKEMRKRVSPEAEIILMTGQASVETAIEAIQHGANDYICKPFSIGVLQAIAASARQRCSANRLIEVKSEYGAEAEILGSSPQMIEVVKAATRVAATDLPVMICGESGTGKELIARLIHRKSARANRPFVAINCGALPDALLESELFGHTRGAFTGADSNRRGLFEEADGGTLLLDEVTETSPAFQVKLLRVLQEGEISPLGTNTRKKVNVRILSTTNRDPQVLIEKGQFRQDLLYRLKGVEIFLPPLRERQKDIRPMALAFLSQHRSANQPLSISEDAMQALEAYRWPGNVRELKHTMQRLAALSSGCIRLEDLPPEIISVSSTEAVLNDIIQKGNLPTLEQLEASYLARVLDVVGGNKARAAQIMGVDRKTLYRMINRHMKQSANP